MRTVAAALLLLLLAGCMTLLSPQRDSSRFFALSVAAGSGAAVASATTGKTYGVGPVRLPDYLDRNEICTRLSAAELTYSEHDRWASPLRASVGEVLAQDLAIQLGGSRVVVYPWSVADVVDAQVEVDVQRFEADPDGKATLVARWTVRDAARKPLLVRESTHTRDAAGRDMPSTVIALSEALADLAKEVANALPKRER